MQRPITLNDLFLQVGTTPTTEETLQGYDDVTVHEILAHWQQQFPDGFTSREGKRALKAHYGSVPPRLNLYTLLVEDGLLSRQLIVDAGPKGKQYKYSVCPITPSPAPTTTSHNVTLGCRQLAEAYLDLCGMEMLEKAILGDDRFMATMRELKDINSDHYQRCGGMYLDLLLKNNSEGETL